MLRYILPTSSLVVNRICVLLILSAFSMSFSYSLNAQVCRSNYGVTAADSRYEVSTGSTVLDLKTGLMWQQCILGRGGSDCRTELGTIGFQWDAALLAVDEFNKSGTSEYSDWRIPNITELLSLVEISCYNPAINMVIFPGGRAGSLLSSTLDAQTSNFIWSVFMFYGNSTVRPRSEYFDVQLVRGGS